MGFSQKGEIQIPFHLNTEAQNVNSSYASYHTHIIQLFIQDVLLEHVWSSQHASLYV